MKPSFTRRYRRRSKPANKEGAFFKKESKAEPTFFGEASQDAFFQPATAVGQTMAVQRKCADCEKEDKNVHRAADKKEEDKKLMRAEEKKEEDKKLQRAPEKKEEDDKKVMRAEDKKEEDKKLQRAPNKKEEDDKKLQRATDKKEEEDKKVMRAEDKKEEEIQKKEAGGATASATNASAYIGSLNGKGNALSPVSNQFFSQRMNYDFSNVRVHTDKEAAESAKSVNAKAYTIGNNIVFNEGQYNTESQEGKRLMAHELTHVMQQKSAENGGEQNELQRTINYAQPNPRKRDPIPLILSSAGSKLGETYIMINGRKMTNKADMIKTIWEGFNNGLTLSYDPVAKACKVNTQNININISADIAVLTDAVNDKWKGQYAGGLVSGSPTCSKLATVNIELLSNPSGGAALKARVDADENDHYQDILRLAKKHLEAFYNYLTNLSLPAASEGECAQKFNAEVGTKDMAMATAFADEWIAAIAVFDNPSGAHHYKSVTNAGNCNPVTITVSF